MNRHEKNDEVGESIANATRVKEIGNIDTSSWNGLVPYSLSRRTFPYFDNGGCKVKETEEDNENSDAAIEGTFAMWREDAAVE